MAAEVCFLTRLLKNAVNAFPESRAYKAEVQYALPEMLLLVAEVCTGA